MNTNYSSSHRPSSIRKNWSWPRGGDQSSADADAIGWRGARGRFPGSQVPYRDSVFMSRAPLPLELRGRRLAIATLPCTASFANETVSLSLFDECSHLNA
ncbi:hypothetical protein KC19_1G079500 [Ceratodon purpureus]|uniref:Uncharacterized protein n=1 Tax=Ceratodon purpureus TaxID=3225 RepID=A0A8T0J568_CERPU|nr:hypothetical protein KC19_1G079500 [Ceratodon purpureus]